MIEQALISNATLMCRFSAIGLSFLLYWMLDHRPQPVSGRVKVILNLLLVYLIIVGCAAGVNAYLDWRITTFDLNGDDIFSHAESTPEQGFFMTHWVLDAGRNLAPFTGVVIAPILVAIAYALTLVRRLMTIAFHLCFNRLLKNSRRAGNGLFR
ncbi:hypothetical protein H4S14_002961 [Agrobacterium vitis]|nr:hypothetical protein [Agrobacterium vitis]MBE1439199.1 hypothetical protein [Agrobacterium vitis]